MASESTSTTFEEAINNEWITSAFHDYARAWTGVTRFLKRYDLRGKATATVAVPNLVSILGTPSDGGSSVATAFNSTEGTDLSNTQRQTTEVTISTIEYGLMSTVTDTVLEDTIDGVDFINILAGDAARVLVTAFEDDVCGRFVSFTAQVGSTGSPMTFANLDSAISGIRIAGIRAPDGLVAYLDDEQGLDFETLVTATGASTNLATHPGSADRFMQIERDLNNGLTEGRIGVYKNINLYTTGLTDTTNTGADVVGAVFVPSTPANDSLAALGMAVNREFTVAFERDESLRATEIIATQRLGQGILLNGAGRAVVTDAP